MESNRTDLCSQILQGGFAIRLCHLNHPMPSQLLEARGQQRAGLRPAQRELPHVAQPDLLLLSTGIAGKKVMNLREASLRSVNEPRTGK